MITHIVFWKLKEENKEENAAIIKQKLEALVGIVPGLLKAEVGRNLLQDNYDLCLVSQFTDQEALAAYRVHPEHQKAASFVHASMCGRTAVDFENEDDFADLPEDASLL